MKFKILDKETGKEVKPEESFFIDAEDGMVYSSTYNDFSGEVALTDRPELTISTHYN